MRVLVTGAFGFVGTAVVNRLTAAGHEVRALTSRPPGARADEGSQARIDVFHGDVCDPEAMSLAVKNVDAVCHLAALARVRKAQDQMNQSQLSQGQAKSYWDVNYVGTETLMNAAVWEAERRGEPLRFVFASTGAVYGEPAQQPIPEDLPVIEPISDYGTSKLAAETLLTAGEDYGHLGVVILRLFNVTGAVDGKTADPETLIPKTLAAAHGERPALEIDGDGESVRDFVHVEDAARAFELAMGHATRDRRAVFNVGATRAKVLDVVRTVEEVTGRAVPVVHRPAHRSEAKCLMADTSRIRSELGWRPERSDLRAIITDAWAASAH